MGSIEIIASLVALRETGYECQQLHETIAIEAEKFGSGFLGTLEEKLRRKLERSFPGCNTEDFFKLCGENMIRSDLVPKKTEGVCAIAGLVGSGVTRVTLTPIPISRGRSSLFDPINWSKLKSELTWSTMGRKRPDPGAPAGRARTELMIESSVVAPLMLLYNELLQEVYTIDLAAIKCIYK
ncbi:ORF32A [Ictalurid herpesvirus 1]|nr:ORF32A [Ictalurid herpesvirus 1]